MKFQDAIDNLTDRINLKESNGTPAIDLRAIKQRLYLIKKLRKVNHKLLHENKALKKIVGDMPIPQDRTEGEFTVFFNYTDAMNTRKRRVNPRGISYKATKSYSKPQWWLIAYDLDAKAVREFALKGIYKWIPMEKLNELDGE